VLGLRRSPPMSLVDETTSPTSSGPIVPPASTSHDRLGATHGGKSSDNPLRDLKVNAHDEDSAVVLGLINDEFIDSSDDEDEEEQSARECEIMDGVVFVDSDFEEDSDEKLGILPELKSIVASAASSEQQLVVQFGTSAEQVSAPESIGHQTDLSDARTTSTSPVDDRSVPDDRSMPDDGAGSEVLPDEDRPTTTVAVQALYHLPAIGREQVELELASNGVLIQESEEHRRIVLIEQVEVKKESDDSDSDSENEAVVLTAVPAADMTAHTRAQASIWLSISRYWSQGHHMTASRRHGEASSPRTPEERATRHDTRHDRAAHPERSRSNSPDRSCFSHAVHGALEMMLTQNKP